MFTASVDMQWNVFDVIHGRCHNDSPHMACSEYLLDHRDNIICSRSTITTSVDYLLVHFQQTECREESSIEFVTEHDVRVTNE